MLHAYEFNPLKRARAADWIADFEGQTKTTYRITRGVKTMGIKVVYKIIRHCQHKHKPSSKPQKKKPGTLQDKKTECPSHFTIINTLLSSANTPHNPVK
jgi:GH24 family phage-related lysozyme (muramidase)